MEEREHIKYEKGVQTWNCKECDNDMIPQMYTRSPYEGVLLQCINCYREIDVEGVQKEVTI